MRSVFCRFFLLLNSLPFGSNMFYAMLYGASVKCVSAVGGIFAVITFSVYSLGHFSFCNGTFCPVRFCWRRRFSEIPCTPLSIPKKHPSWSLLSGSQCLLFIGKAHRNCLQDRENDGEKIAVTIINTMTSHLPLTMVDGNEFIFASPLQQGKMICGCLFSVLFYHCGQIRKRSLPGMTLFH